MSDPQFKALEQKIDDLISLCAELNSENQALKAQADDWLQERHELVTRNELARNRVDAIISRLKALEQET